MSDDTPIKAGTPQEAVDAIYREAASRISTEAGQGNWLFWPELQEYSAKAIREVVGEAVTLSVRAIQGPSSQSQQQNVEWNLTLQSSPLRKHPIPTYSQLTGEDLDESIREKLELPDGWEPRSGYTSPPPAPYTGTRYAPEHRDVVDDIDKEYPGLVGRDPGRFTELVAARLNEMDSNFGLKSRRGGPISNDTIAYKRPDGKIEAIDIVVNAGRSYATLGWSNIGPVDGEWHQP